MWERVRIIGALIIFMCMIVPSIGMASVRDEIAADPHTWWYTDQDFVFGLMRDSCSDGVDPHGGSARWYVLDIPTEVNTDVSTNLGAPYSGMSDWIGPTGQSGMPYCAKYTDGAGQSNPTVGENTIHFLEKDPNCAVLTPDVYYNNGVEVGTGFQPHGYIWAGISPYIYPPENQAIIFTGDPPTAFFEVMEMAAPHDAGGNTGWNGLDPGEEPADIAGGVGGTEARIESWGLLESTSNTGPWTEVGQAAFGVDIVYAKTPGDFYSAVPYFSGGVRSLVYSKPIEIAAPPVFQVSDLLATPHQPTDNDIQLEWSEIPATTEYNIYESTEVDGTGFNFSVLDYVVPATGTGKVIFTLPGKYADASIYSWVVRAANADGENTDDLDNIAFKLVYYLYTGAAALGADNNYIALPYRVNGLTNNAQGLITDMRQYGSPQNSVSSLQRWNQDSGSFDVKPPLFGTNFPLIPGEAYMAVVTQPVVTYKMVGAYDSTVMPDIGFGSAALGYDHNYISLPYHYNFPDATGLLSSMRATGNPINNISTVNRWNQDTGVFDVKPPMFGTNFPLKPGEGYMVVSMVAAVDWTCHVATPGP